MSYVLYAPTLKLHTNTSRKFNRIAHLYKQFVRYAVGLMHSRFLHISTVNEIVRNQYYYSVLLSKSKSFEST